MPLTTRRSLLTRSVARITRTRSQSRRHIMLESGQGRVWLVKVRTQPSIPHVYTHLPSQDPEFPNGAPVQIRRRRGRTAHQDPDLRRAPGAAPCIIVLIPSDDCGDGDIYELDTVKQDVHPLRRRPGPCDDSDRKNET